MHTHKGIASVLWLIIAALFGGGVWLFWWMNALEKGVAGAKKTPEVLSEELNRQREIAETADWKTYRNEEYGFEFRYPTGLYIHNSGYGNGTGWWFLTQEPVAPVFGFEDICGTAKDYLTIQAHGNYRDIFVWSKYDSVDALIRGWEDDFDTGTKISNVVVNGVRVVEFSLQGAPRFYFIHNSNIYSVSYQKCSGGQISIKDIVSTFRFTREADTETSWNTYRNEKYGFEVKHPPHIKIEESGQYGIRTFLFLDESRTVDKSYEFSFLSPRVFDVTVHPSNLVEDQYKTALSYMVVPGSVTGTTVDGKEAEILETKWNNLRGDVILIKHDSKLYTLSYWEDDSKLNNLGGSATSKAILSTFRFTK